jgi:hypothetical protein
MPKSLCFIHFVALASTLVVLVAGCSNSRKGRVTAVEGTVKLDGQPLVKVYVRFLPENANLPGSTATTDETGHYVLRTADDRTGAIVGKHRVVIADERADERSGKKGSPRSVPTRYTSATADNPLGTVEVLDSKSTGYDFELKTK